MHSDIVIWRADYQFFPVKAQKSKFMQDGGFKYRRAVYFT